MRGYGEKVVVAKGMMAHVVFFQSVGSDGRDGRVLFWSVHLGQDFLRKGFRNPVRYDKND